MGADDHHRTRASSDVLQCGVFARCDERHGEKLQRTADDRCDRHRDVFALGCRLRDARRQAEPALRGSECFSSGGFAVRFGASADDVQPQRYNDDHRARTVWCSGGSTCSVVGRSHRRKLPGDTAGNRIGCSWLGPRRRGCSGISDWRYPWYLYRLAASVRVADCALRHRLPAEFPSETRSRAARCPNRYRRRCPVGRGHHSH